jgi:hypothetical protein
MAVAIALAQAWVGNEPYAATGVIQTVNSSPSRIVFEVDVGDPSFRASSYRDYEILDLHRFGSFSAPGEPLIPGRDFLVALPPQGAASVSYTVLRSEPLGKHRLEPVPFPVVFENGDGVISTSLEYRFDPAIYDAVRPGVRVSGRPEGRLRHQRVLPVRVEPVMYDPLTGEVVLAKRIRVEIVMSGANQGGAPLPSAPVEESEVWERMYARLLVNYDGARAWRTRARPAPSLRSSRALDAAAGPLVKLAARTPGVHRVRASTVIGRGFPAGTPTGSLHLFQRAYDRVTASPVVLDIPYRVVEDTGGTAGEFDGADWLIFYAQELREDTLRHDPIEKFTEDNIYWLGTSGGPQMPPKALAPDTVAADTATSSFPVTLYEEQDLVFREQTPPDNNSSGATVTTREFYYYTLGRSASFGVPFDLESAKSGTTFELKALFLGRRVTLAQGPRPVRLDLINARGTTRLPDVNVPETQFVLYSTGPLSSDVLAPGLNTFRIQPIGRSDIDVLLDWLTVDYASRYIARGNRLSFDTGSLVGSRTLTLTGFTRTDVLLFDITNPLAPEACPLDASFFTSLGAGEYALSFRLDLTTPRRFVVLPFDAITEIAGASVVEDEPSALIGHPLESGVDVLVVSHRTFIGEMQRWVDYRKAQGYRVLLADVDDIYDEFNGGVRNPKAIRDFVGHFFQSGGASFLVLAGDASEDYKRVLAASGVDFVPTESYAEHVASPVFNEDEVVTTDKWYVMLDKDILYDEPLSTADHLPELIVGRFPAGSVAEMRLFIDKTLAFEQPRADDFWRRRMIRVADDAWSGPGIGEVCLQPVEREFENAEENASVITEGSIPGGYDVVRFYLSKKITYPQGCVAQSVQQAATRASATPALLGELTKGATIVSFQAHMNRYLICHEALFTSSPTLGGTDYQAFTNNGKPFIVFGMGCHMSDFALHSELSRNFTNGPTGDCLSELLLLQPNRGAVCSYGSTGFEYLNENKNYTGVIAEIFFEEPPTGPMIPTGRSQARWIMGELMTTAEVENLLRYPGGGSGGGAIGQVKRYHTLGDPMLRIEGGPPRFEVTVDGNPFESGDLLFSGGGGDSVHVRGVITDEAAIEKISLVIDGIDATNLLTVTPLVDAGLDAARQYEVSFATKLVPKTYDIVIRAHQAADTTAGDYHVVAEFILSVEVRVSLSINGRVVVDGDVVPSKGDYVFELTAPVVVDPGLIRVEIDGAGVTPLNLSHPSPEDSTTWLVGFAATLSNGAHRVSVFVENAEFDYTLTVGTQYGVRDVIAYPNPFADDTYIVYTNEFEISDGSIDIFTTSGKKVATLAIPVAGRAVGQNAVHWDGTTWNGSEVANGVYLFVMSVRQGEKTTTERGKMVKVR